jgi:uncharacterized protein YycO
MARMVLAQRDTSRFSHVGILIKTCEGLSVIHAIPSESNNKGIVLIESMTDYFSKENASAGSVFRLKGISSNESKMIVEYAFKKIGKPFDNRFQYQEDSAYYCTELVLKAMRAAGKNIQNSVRAVSFFTMTEPVILPDDLRTSGMLEKVLDINFEGKE